VDIKQLFPSQAAASKEFALESWNNAKKRREIEMRLNKVVRLVMEKVVRQVSSSPLRECRLACLLLVVHLKIEKLCDVARRRRRSTTKVPQASAAQAGKDIWALFRLQAPSTFIVN